MLIAIYLVAYRLILARHRFTATLMTQLLKTSFKAPHRVLSAYIEIFSGFHPNDAQELITKETSLAELGYSADQSWTLDFSKILSGEPLASCIVLP